jgi:hypothetical protein
MKTIKTEFNGKGFDLTVSGYHYGDRLNVSIHDIAVEDELLSDEEIESITQEVFWQIDCQEGEIYERLREQAVEFGFIEICSRGKY